MEFPGGAYQGKKQPERLPIKWRNAVRRMGDAEPGSTRGFEAAFTHPYTSVIRAVLCGRLRDKLGFNEIGY